MTLKKTKKIESLKVCYKDICVKYANDIISDIIPSSSITKKCCERFLSDIIDTRFYIDETVISKMIKFFNRMPLPDQPELKYFNPEPWQIFFLFNIFSIYKLNGNRKHTNVMLYIARKNGKSTLLVATLLYQLIFSKNESILVGANSMNQIKEVDKDLLVKIIALIDPDQQLIKVRFNKIFCGSNKLLFIASDTTKLDGFNASIGCLEEIHEMKNNNMFNIIRSSQGTRKDRLIIAVTTAGNNKTYYGYNQYEYFSKLYNGEFDDDNSFGLIYEIEKADLDSLDSLNTITKANPNVNISFDQSFINDELNRVKNSPIDFGGLLTKNFNYYLESKTVNKSLVDYSDLSKCLKAVDLTTLSNQEYTFYAGIDLGSVNDLTSLSVIGIPENNTEQIYVKNYYYTCEESLSTGENKEYYKKCLLNKEITITGGNTTDYQYILNDLLKLNQQLDISVTGYDSWNSTQFVINATEEGLNMMPFSQGTQSINRPTKELQRLILSERIIIDDNSITKWMFNNTTIKEIGNNVRPEKLKKSAKVDGVFSILNALGIYFLSPNYNFKVW